MKRRRATIEALAAGLLIVSMGALCALAVTPAEGDAPAATPVEGDALAATTVDDCALTGAALRCGKARALAQRHAAGHVCTDEIVEYRSMVDAGLREAFDDTDLLHCDLEVEVVPDEYDNLYGTNTMTIQSTVDNLTQFTFRLRSQFTIDSAVVNDVTPVTISTPSSTTRVAALDRAYMTGETFTLTIEYHGHAESRGFGSIEFTTHYGADIVYTLSEPYYSYTWWPIKDGDFGESGDNSDKFTLDIAIIAPDGMVSASNGVLLGVDSLFGGRQRYRWSSDYPICPYLVCFSTTNYNTWTEYYTPIAGGSMPVLFYIYPESDNSSNRAAWSEVVQMMYTLREIFGEYPFVNEKYGIYECQFGGGMEHQTFTAQGTFNEGVTVHELGHQWWGDMITCKTWNDIWLNEGFASYTEALWAERKPGSTGLPALKSSMASMKYTGGGSVYVTNDELSNLYSIFSGSTSYDKGAWVVHMLRHVLGDDDFFLMLATYRAAFEFSAATTSDLQLVCETIHGDSLDWFFQEWIYGEYAPAYAYGWSTTEINGQHYLLLYVDQTQSASYQRFTMPIDIRVDGVDHVIFNDADNEHFVIPIAAAPSTVELDPDAWILWSSRSTTSYVAGPPTIVQTAPLPGASHPAVAAIDSVEITFHTDVNTSAGDYALVGAQAGAIPVTFAYDGSNTVTLTASAPLPPDSYTLTVADAVTAVSGGAQLDGEIADAANPASLPTGDGLAGGDAVFTFGIGGVLGDMNCDGAADVFDIDAFVLAITYPAGYATTYPQCDIANGDCNADTMLDVFDIDCFVAAIVGG